MDKIDKLASKLDNIAQIINLLSREVEINLEIPGFQISVRQLISKHEKLVALNELLCQDMTTLDKGKLDRRRKLADITFQIVRILQVFAFNNKKKYLQQRLKSLTFEYLQGSSDKELLKISKKIGLIANKYGGATITLDRKGINSPNSHNSIVNINFEKEYGLSLDMIKNFSEAKIRVVESVTSYRGEIKEREKVAKRIKFLDKQTDKLLANKIDHFLLLCRTERPNYYQEYRQLREIQIQDFEYETEVPD